MRKYHNNLGVLCGLTVIIMAVSLFGVVSKPASGMEKDDTIIETIEEDDSTNNIDFEQEQIDEKEVVEEDVPETINGLLIGFDKSGLLTDVLMVGHINPEKDEIKVISVPRDLEVFFYDDAFVDIKKNNPKNGVAHCKINEIYYHLGKDQQALEDLRDVVGRICNLDIDYIMTVDLNDVRDVVDAVGGVEFDVPMDMYYHDPVQDLHIDLKKGLQLLDGDKAEQLIRYRKGYSNQDLGRIEVQQEFVAAFVDTVIQTRDFDKISELLSTAYDMVGTNFGLVVMMEYAEFFYNLDMEHVLESDNMIQIPSYGEKVEEHWFQYFDIDKAHKAVADLLEGRTDSSENK